MSQTWSETHKMVNVSVPFAHVATTSFTSDIVNLENYKKCTFIVATGAGVANTPVITVGAGNSNAGAATAIVFKYRTQTNLLGSDTPSALTDATATGFAITTTTTGAAYIIEADASTVAAAGTDYDHVALIMSTGALGATHTYGITAVLSEPRYPQGVLQTAID